MGKNPEFVKFDKVDKSYDGKVLVVADNLAKYYLLDLNNGELLWSKNNLAPFNSQIKIYQDKFFIIDFSNTLRCFSVKNGKEIWNIKTENSLKFGILSFNSKKIVIKKFPLNEIHFFPIVPRPFV